jgi:hypothetical protein
MPKLPPPHRAVTTKRRGFGLGFLLAGIRVVTRAARSDVKRLFRACPYQPAGQGELERRDTTRDYDAGRPYRFWRDGLLAQGGADRVSAGNGRAKVHGLDITFRVESP